MKLFIKLRNKYFTAFMSLVLLVMASIGLFNLCKTPQSVEASMIKFDNEKTITITNGSFTSFSSSSTYPYTLSGFTTSGNKTPEMKTGAISISDSDYAKNYTNYGLGEFENPKGVGKDNYVLMINADKDSNYTYTSSEFTLPANGHYYITVSAKTIGSNSVSSVFLTKDGAIFEDCLIENITSTTWSNYTFFVSTNSYESVTLKFGMQIGSQVGGASGCVLFDELHAGQISSETLNNCLNTFETYSYKYVKYNTNNAYKEYNFDSKIIEYTRDNKGQLVYNEGNPVVVTTNENYFDTVTSGAGEKSAEIVNNALTLTATDSYLNYKGKEEVLDANSTYRFSMFVKASQLTKGSAFVKIDEIIDENEDEYDDFMDSENADKTAKSSNLKISSVTSNTVTNGYVEYLIYVRTGSLGSSTVQFSFGLGTSDESASGNVSFKSYSITRVPYSAYSSASTGDTLGKIDISERYSANSSEFSNYAFNQMQSESFDGIPYPATPVSWTKSNSGNGEQLSGIVNLSSFDKVMDKYSYINTISTPSTLNNVANNNVLMIYNGTNSSQSYKSTSKSLSASKFHKVTAFVNTYISGNSDNGATIVVKNGNAELGKIDNINTAGTWKKVEFYINTPANSVSITLELALGYGNKLASGYAFFDNILVEESETAGEFSNRFGNIEVLTSTEIDLTNPMISSTTSREYNIPILYTGENNGETAVNAGIVDLNGDLKMVAESKREALKEIPGDNKNVLAIATALEEDGYYSYKSLLSYSFESSKYYKLSFSLFTDGIGQVEKEEMYDNGKLAQGVNIELSGLENAKFAYIQSEGKWTDYEIYVGVNSTTSSNLIFTLGSEFTGCYGKAFLGNINLEEVQETEFTSIASSDTTLKVDTVKTDDEEDTETETTKDSGNNFSWVYIPTIATFLAIIVAVVGVFVRRNVKFKKGVKNKKAVYDRDITVMQNKYRRLALDTRDKEVRELTKERDELVAMRTEYEEKYKDALSRLRSTRLANRDGSKRHEIMAIEHEVKHISKEVARFGVQVNNYENEIEFMQTEAYIIDLEKRMMREDNSSRNQLRKEAEMTEEDRLQAVAKREVKQQRAQEKAQAKADKLASKQAKLQQQREQVQQELQQAKQLDEKYVKEQELKQIRLEEQRIAKEKAKAERELEKLEQSKAKEVEETEEVDNQQSQPVEKTVETVESNDQVSETNNEVSNSVDNIEVENTQVENSQTDNSETSVETNNVETDNK